ncbi:MAG: phosphoribosylaminoimidazolesuccinocarboxamide synthase [Pirellulaceae bacterium]|nr:phosphoribosylaminoimidazolesuccinocarboxamide synthase [Pirellulaceae bacterium]
MEPVTKTTIEGIPSRHGKVRDIYDFTEKLLLVSTDRISAFDWVFEEGIPNKGQVLTQISKFWFEKLGEKHHMLSTDLSDVDFPAGTDVASFEGRSMVCKKAEVIPIECVVRSYLVGSGWKEYQQDGKVCGIVLEPGLQLCSKLPEPIFTPSTKADEGHDENISFEQMVEVVGQKVADELKERSLDIFKRGSEYARERGIIIADTKFEFGTYEGEIILIDEVLTPDSSRFWPADTYEVGKNQFSFDKQFVRDWLETTDWDKNSQPPQLPDVIVQKTAEKYIEAYERLTESEFPWKNS